MAQIGWFVFSGGGAIFFLALAGVWLLVSGDSRRARLALAALSLFYWVASTNLVADRLRSLIASPYAPLTRQAVPHGRTAVVLLGSGGFGVRDWAGTQFAVVDRIGLERHELSGLAKDVGSTAVLLAFALLIVVWAGVLLG